MSRGFRSGLPFRCRRVWLASCWRAIQIGQVTLGYPNCPLLLDINSFLDENDMYVIRHYLTSDEKDIYLGKTGKGEPTMKDRTHDEAMAELYREDPAYVLQLLNSILEDGDQSELLIALRQMAKAFGGVQAIAEQAHLNPTQLYRTLSPQGNPALSSISAILKAMGMRLAVQPVRPPAAQV